MLLYSLLLTFCLAVSAESSLDGTSLLGMIRKDPNALVKMFETATADKDVLLKIKVLLGNLVTEGQDEIERIRKDIIQSKQSADTAQTAYTKAVALEKTLSDVHGEAKKKVDTAQGVWEAIDQVWSRESPILQNEITVFDKVITILSNLLNGKDLVEEESEQVKAFIAFTDQADPAKVKRVIAIVNKLKKASVDELTVLKSKTTQAKEDLQTATDAMDHAYGEWDAAKKDLVPKKEARDAAIGRYQAIMVSGKKRIVVLNEEFRTLNSVITLIKKLKAT